jgi:flagellar motor switch protein FliN
MGLNISQDEIDALLGIDSPAAPTPPPPAAESSAAPPPPPSAPLPPPPPPTPSESASFNTFDSSAQHQNVSEITLVKEVVLDLTVELGKTKKPIKEILDFGLGTVIELDRIAGEPVDLYANNKLIAKGEVVVIEDHFGLRVTEILGEEKK